MHLRPPLRQDRRGARVGWFLALALALLTVFTGCNEDSRLTLHVVENHLADGHGRPLRLLGVNRSGAPYVFR